MEPVSLIVAALALGAKDGLAGAAKSAIADAYQGLKKLVGGRLGADANVVDSFEAKPDVWRPALEDVLDRHGLGADDALVEAAKALLDKAGPQATVAAEQYAINGDVTVTATNGGVAVVRVGDGAVFNAGERRDPPTPER